MKNGQITAYTSSPLRPAVNALAALLCALLIMAMNGCASTQRTSTVSASQGSGQADGMVVESSHGSFELTPTVVGYDEAQFSDPLEGFNRSMFSFNDFVFRHILIPTGKGYQHVVPKPVRSGVSHFFSNLREPLNAINHGLQGNAKASGVSIGRFLINSTLGLLGLFDPAQDWFDIKQQKATLNQTLASYDVGYGSFLVLPFLGQTDTRNGFSTLVEGIFHPVNYLSDAPQSLYIQAYGSFHEFAPQAESYETLKQNSEDPYLFFRNMYLQGVLRDEQFSQEAMPNEAFPLNPHSSGQATPAKSGQAEPDSALSSSQPEQQQEP